MSSQMIDKGVNQYAMRYLSDYTWVSEGINIQGVVEVVCSLQFCYKWAMDV